MFAQKKLAGILIENGSIPSSIVIGVGMNINMNDEKCMNNWSSLAKIAQTKWDRNQIAAFLIEELFFGLKEFKNDGFKSFLPSWEKYDAFFNKQVRIKTDAVMDEGVMCGVDACGRVLLQRDGVITAYVAGSLELLKNNE